MAYIRIPLWIHQLLFALEDRRVLSSFVGFLNPLKTQSQFPVPAISGCKKSRWGQLPSLPFLKTFWLSYCFILTKTTNFLSLQDMFRQNLSSSVEWLQSKLNYKFWIQVADLKQLPGLKGEGHSKNREFFSITNKMFTLSWVTHHCFSISSGCDPKEKEVKSSTLGAAILKGS